MNKVYCPYGHLYDKDEFPFCPICAQNNHPNNGWQNPSFPNSQDNPNAVAETIAVNRNQRRSLDPQSSQNSNLHPSMNFGNYPQQQSFSPTVRVSRPNASFHVSVQSEPQLQPPYQQPNQWVPYQQREPQSQPPYQQTPPYSQPPYQRIQMNIPIHSGASDSETVYFSKSFSNEPVAGWLVCVFGEDKGHYFRVPTQKATIGRSDDNKFKINLNDKKISRKHPIGTIVYDDNLYQFYFIAETSGNLMPYINGQPVMTQMRLKDYDELRIGDTVLLFRTFCSDENIWNNMTDR